MTHALREMLIDHMLLMDKRRAERTALTMIILSFAVKTLIAFFDVGFYSGDDVEVFEMVFARLFDWESYQAWALRNPFYPFVFIFPVQKLLLFLGVSSPSTLVFAGRMVVVLFSCFNLWLVFEIARREFENQAVGLTSLLIFGLNVHYTGFSASILPRIIASTFLLLCLLVLVRRSSSRGELIWAALFLAISGAIRYSEITFFLPAAIFIQARIGTRATAFFAGLFIVFFFIIVGIADYLYWGEWFKSLKEIVLYTLIEKKSTRGYQGSLYYLEHVRHWADWITFLMAFVSLRWNTWKLFLWFIIPTILLSALPHKEPRYLIPVMPFVSILAGVTFWRVLGVIKQWDNGVGRNRELTRKGAQVLPVLLLLGIFALGIANYRFPRADSAIFMANWLRAQTDKGGLVGEQLWRLGSRIYLSELPLRRDWAPKGPDSLDQFSDFLDNPKIKWAALLHDSIEEMNLIDILNQHHFIEINCGGVVSERPYYRLFQRMTSSNP